LERFAEAFGPAGFRREAFYPCYGLAEATLFVAGGRHGAAPAVEGFAPAGLARGEAIPEGTGRPLVGCGGTWAGQQIVVADPEAGARVEPGRIGEIWVAGASVAAGYWDRPEETARTFGARLTDGSGPFLRTGDLGFVRDGELFVTGRLKDLIILRGRNHYPQELELTAERAHPDLEPGSVAAFSVDVTGEERLVLVLEIGRRSLKAFRGLSVPAAATAVRRAIAEEHEVQVYEVVLIRPGTLPRTSSGKVQRHACRSAWLAGGEDLEIVGRDAVDLAVVVQETTEAETLRDLSPEARRAAVVEWLRGELARAAGVDPAGLGEDAAPASAGLDSLAAVEIGHRLETLLGVALPLTRWLEARSLGALAEEIAARLDEPVEEIEAAGGREGEARLSVGQQGLWLLERMAPGVYNVPVPLRVLGALDVEALERGLRRLGTRHPALRGVDRVEIEERIERLVEEAYRPFDLDAGPLLRAAIFPQGNGESILLLTVHHIAVDFWSLAVLVRELSALYREETGGEAAVLPAPVRTFADHVAREERRLAGPEGEALWTYWRDALAGGLHDLELATDRPRPPVQTFRGLSVPFSLEPEVAGSVTLLARRQGATAFATLLAAFGALLHRYTGQEDFAVGAPTAGRESADVAEVVGYFVNLLPLRAGLSGRPAFSELIARTATVVTGGLAHQAFPFPRLAERLRPQRDPSRPPVFQVSFALQKAHRAEERAWSAFALGEEGARAELGGLAVESVKLAERRVPFEIVLTMAETDAGLAGSLQVNADLFDAATAERMASHFATLLAEMTAEPERQVVELPLLTEAELRQVRHVWGRTAPAAKPFLVHREVEKRAVERPEAPALVSGDLRVTYAELNHRANALASFLRKRGIGPEKVVGLAAERSPELVVGALAVLKAGAAYLPLDPAQPVERLRRMLADSGARVLLTREELSAGLSREGVGTILLDRLDLTGFLAESPGEPDVPLFPENLAYLIYTSGSTGVPKGAEMCHAGLANLVAWHRATYGVTQEDRATLVAGVGFDASVWEMWPYLTAGASVWIPSPETVASPPDLLAWIAQQRITLAFLPTPLAEAALAAPLPEGLALRALLTGGDRLLTRPPAEARFELVNHYGPTEGTVVSTAGRVASGEHRVPPIGRPIAGVRVEILDRELRPVPAGVPGEILLGGAGLARGYLGHPRLTAEAFLPDPSGDEPGGRVYRSGDLARWLPDGRIEFLGRRDHQVKIRGFRIELGEVEAALRACPGVREAVVLARPGAGGQRLVGSVVPESLVSLDFPDELRSRLRERLPEPMVPSAFLFLEALPLTPNGKVDREALARLQVIEEGPAAARTPTEERLAAVWAEVLGIERIGAEDDFFALGGHSLLASRVASRVREAFSVELPLAVFFERPRLKELAAVIEAERGLGSEDLPLAPVPRQGEIPLSFSQERLWFLDRLQPGSAVYNIPAAIRLRGALDAAVLDAALGALVERHEALRTTFPVEEGRPFQRIHPAGDFHLDRIDLTAAADPDAKALRLAWEEAGRPFDLAAGPLFRAALLRIGDEDHVLLLNLHHSIADGWSMDVLARDLSALAAGEPVSPLPVQYADYAVWQRRRLAGPVLDRLLAVWRERLAGAPAALELPTDRPRPAAQSYRGAVETLTLPAIRGEGATRFMTVLAALAAVLHRYTGQDDVLIGSPVAGRDRRELEGLIGFFVNTVPLRLDLAGDPDFAALVQRALRATLDAHAGAEVPFEKLVEELRPVRDLSRSPLFQVLITVQDGPGEPLRLSDVTAESISPAEVHGGTAKFDLTVALQVSEEGILGGIEYATDLFDAATIRRLGGHLGVLLGAAAADPARRLGDLPLLTPGEERQALVEWNATDASYPAESRLHELFEEQARRTPEATAVVWGTERVTYAELDQRAETVAAWLLAQGLEPEERVGVSMPRTPDLIAALLGVLKSGGAYVPIDPGYPRERIEFLVRDSAARLVLTRTDTDEHRHDTDVPEAAPAVRESPWSSVSVRVRSSSSLAYLIYTSGSTGTPKGVGVRHASAVARVAWAASAYPAEVWRGVLAATSVNFDLSVFEIFVPLSLGGTVILADDALALQGLPAAGEVTLINTVPSAMAELLRLGAVPAGARVVNLAGEALRRELAEAVLALPQGPELWNLYGPSEDTTYSTGARIERGTEAPPIGRPLPNSRAYVLDGYGQIAPVGVPGELWLGGAGVARGYLGRPDLTADRFRPDPFDTEPGGRLYRTGDLVRRRVDGALDYLGRLDQQVKVRGFRVELGEIEAALGAYPGVAAAAVVAPEGADGVRRLIAWIVPAGELDAESVREHLARRLPSHMVPSLIMSIEAMPRTPNGKVDRQALATRAVQPAAAETEAPRTAAEMRVASVWGELLGVERVGREDSFFALGGHSLQAARLTARVRDVFGIEMPVRAVFERATLAAFASLIDELAAAEGRTVEAPAAAMPRDGRDLPLSFAQERLWFLDQLESGTAFYNIPTAVRLRGPLRPELFRGALQEVVRRHEALRTTFTDVQGRPVQVIAPDVPVELPLLDLSGLPAEAAEAEMRAQAGEEIRRPFDLVRGPLFRAILFRMGGEGHIAILTLHHIIADGWSLGVLIREISALYQSLAAGRPSPLPPLPIQYADFAVWQRKRLHG
ncbi:MAG TPA: amino acid adenylation domain-containing protein, partial [Thermoanaerobaculia bacterium]|nr:amino acid adenylation domain-containing protein [Thermoanaerobaculia bacterium]